MQVKIEGLEDEVRRILADVLAEREGGDPWYTTEGAALYLGTTVGQMRNLRLGGQVQPVSAGHEVAGSGARTSTATRRSSSSRCVRTELDRTTPDPRLRLLRG